MEAPWHYRIPWHWVTILVSFSFSSLSWEEKGSPRVLSKLLALGQEACKLFHLIVELERKGNPLALSKPLALGHQACKLCHLIAELERKPPPGSMETFGIGSRCL